MLPWNMVQSHAKFDIHHIYGAWENPSVNVSDKPRHLPDQKLVNYLTWIHTTVAQVILCPIFLMYVVTIPILNYCEQEYKRRNL